MDWSTSALMHEWNECINAQVIQSIRECVKTIYTR